MQLHHDVHSPDDTQTCAQVLCDCTHSCHPSWAQMWIPHFLRAFQDRSLYMAGGRPDWRTNGPNLSYSKKS